MELPWPVLKEFSPQQPTWTRFRPLRRRIRKLGSLLLIQRAHQWSEKGCLSSRSERLVDRRDGVSRLLLRTAKVEVLLLPYSVYLLGLGHRLFASTKATRPGSPVTSGEAFTVTSISMQIPLFVHQLSHVWVDFPGIQDAFMRDKQIDYFRKQQTRYLHPARVWHSQSSRFCGIRRALLGLTRGAPPRESNSWRARVNFFDYVARGVPDGPDDGTIAPWAVASLLPFAPEGTYTSSPPGSPVTSGEVFTATSISTQVPSSFTSCLTCGSISGASRTPSCETSKSTISGTAGALLSSSVSMPFATPKIL